MVREFAAHHLKTARRSNAEGCGCDNDDCLCRLNHWLPENVKPQVQCASAFDRISDIYSHIIGGTEQRTRELACLLKKRVRDNNKAKFLDVGCGPAVDAVQLTEEGFEYYGIDSSERMIAQAPQNIHNIYAYHGDTISALSGSELQSVGSGHMLPDMFEVIACRGNTFDYFLGLEQKALLLSLFDQHLEQDGILLFTGYPFSKAEANIKRRTDVGVVQYHCQWHGNYMQSSVEFNHQHKADLILHPCSLEWLKVALDHLGYNLIGESTDWPGAGGSQYNLWAFQRRYKYKRNTRS